MVRIPRSPTQRIKNQKTQQASSIALPLIMSQKTHDEQAVEDMLNRLSGMAPQRCPSCGSLMIDTTVIFFALGSEKTWTMPLAACSQCQPATAINIAAA